MILFPDDSVTIIWANNNRERSLRPTLNRALTDLIFTGTTQAPLPKIIPGSVARSRSNRRVKLPSAARESPWRRRYSDARRS